MTTQTRSQAIQMVAAVIEDPQRSDRILRRAEDGQYYVTDAEAYIGTSGPEYPPSVRIPAANEELSPEALEEWADALLSELDEAS